MSLSKMIGRDGRLVWDNFTVALKYWTIEWDKPDGGKESWHGKAIISQTDLRAMMEERAKSRPIPINELFQVSPLDKSANLSIQAVPKLMSAFQIAINGMKITCDYCNYISKGFKRWIWQEDEIDESEEGR